MRRFVGSRSLAVRCMDLDFLGAINVIAVDLTLGITNPSASSMAETGIGLVHRGSVVPVRISQWRGP